MKENETNSSFYKVESITSGSKSEQFAFQNQSIYSTEGQVTYVSGVGEFKEKIKNSPKKQKQPQSHYRGESFGNCLLLNSGSKDMIENPRSESNIQFDPRSL